MNMPNLRSTVLSLFIITVLFSCRNESGENKEAGSRDELSGEIAEDMEAPLPALPYLAVFDEPTEQLKAEKNTDFNPASLDADGLTQALVANYPEIKPKIDRISNDTLYLHIADAQYLTQQMGSSGAQMYLLEATYAYTELSNINVVNFSFSEGDHALPGNYKRDSFGQQPR